MKLYHLIYSNDKSIFRIMGQDKIYLFVPGIGSHYFLLYELNENFLPEKLVNINSELDVELISSVKIIDKLGLTWCNKDLLKPGTVYRLQDDLTRNYVFNGEKIDSDHVLVECPMYTIAYASNVYKGNTVIL